ncbi:MAG: SDR family oxidoreductase [Acidobacteriota bacterium]
MTTARADLAARRLLVTGAASGIGRRVVGDLDARGARVLAADLTREALDAASSQDGWSERVEPVAFDVRDPDGWDAAIARGVDLWGGLDVVLNVAGWLRPSEVHEASDDDIHRVFDVNVKGVTFGLRAAARHMIERGAGGHIVNIASLASLAPIPGISLYSASKYAVRALSLAAAAELREHDIAVSVVCPDAVRTPMLDLQLDYPQAALTFTAPRFLEAADVSRVILDRVLPRRPLLVALPRRRALLARFADLFPRAQQLISSLLRRQGLKRQRAMRRGE